MADQRRARRLVAPPQVVQVWRRR